MTLNKRSPTIHDAHGSQVGVAIAGEARRCRGEFNFFTASILPGNRDEAAIREMERDWILSMLEDRPQYAFGPRLMDFGGGLEPVIPEKYAPATHPSTSCQKAA